MYEFGKQMELNRVVDGLRLIRRTLLALSSPSVAWRGRRQTLCGYRGGDGPAGTLQHRGLFARGEFRSDICHWKLSQG